MKSLFILLFVISTTHCFAQFDKFTTFSATANFNMVREGLAMNDAGVGLGLDASFFATKRLQAIVEARADHFIGDKQLITDPLTGKAAKNAAVYSIKAGPQFFLTKRVALAATYGPARHIVRAFEYTLDNGFTYSITGFLGQHRRFVTKAFMVNIPADERQIRYIGIAAGVRF